MYIYNLVVRWQNGDLEGFGASSTSELNAHKYCMRKVEQKALDFNITFKVLSRTEYNALTIDEQDEIQRDWDSSKL